MKWLPDWLRRKHIDGDNGRSKLWYSAAFGESEHARAEIDGGTDPARGDDDGYTPLHVAVLNGRVAMVALLLKAGADPNGADMNGNGPLWTAVLSAPEAAQQEIIKQLLAAGANPDHQNNFERSPRSMADTRGGGLAALFARTPVRRS